MMDAGRGSNDVDNSGGDKKKVKSLMESMQRVISSRARKNQSSASEAAASSGCNVVQLQPQISISGL